MKELTTLDLMTYLHCSSVSGWRRINLENCRVPDLVGEISDTSLATDLDEKKQLYAALEIPEYWVVGIKGRQVLAFRLQWNGKYQQIAVSIALEGLPISLLSEMLEQMESGNNINAAACFSQQIANLNLNKVETIKL